MLAYALEYIARGWHVLPLHTPTANGCSCNQRCGKNVGKHPRTKNGLDDATLDKDQVTSWWTMWPQANIGIATGPSGLVVLDVDPKANGTASLDSLEAVHGLMGTLSVRTGGGGTHHYFTALEDRPLNNSAGILGPGLDIRAQGGYVVAPPSLHVSEIG